MFVDEAPQSDRLAARYEQARSDMGFLMNYVKLWGWVPDAEERFRAARGALDEATLLSQREREVIVVATVSAQRDAYCSLAWGKRLAKASDPETAAALVEGRDPEALTQREQALVRWARRVVGEPNATTREHVDELRAAGLGDREIVEATVLVGFRVAFAMVNDALGVIPDAELARSVPEAVRRAVSFGRQP